ncbi:N-6 DNA methylase [Bacillus velezensis]|uniref:HsdM family class I SAM-dependent methyltransferase n=1 Tax=Bacillus velezensis TaxID=492670 RepID=UPI001E3C34BB|nr:N-6 DNA methylase [Bacillus velezensis]MCD7910895.1 N-6 DNA methylase [Bacillus velezensis]
MGRKENKRHENNQRVKELLNKSNHSADEIKFIKESYTGIGGLTQSKWNNGQFFTPLEIAFFTMKMMGIEGGRVLEPSCGGGVFIDVLPPSCDIYGAELMIEAARVSEICYPQATIYQGDTLEMEWDEPFDYVIGNPPYGLTINNWDFKCGKKLKSEAAFIEYGLKWLKPGGILGMIVPDSLLANQREKAFRKHVLNNHQLLAVVSLPIETFYHSGTSVKTSLIMIKKGAVKENYSVFMSLCKNIGWDKKGNLNKSDLPAIYHEYLNSGMSHLNNNLFVSLIESTDSKALSGQLALELV